MDKRKENRYNTQLHVKLNSGSINSWGILSDVSESGLFIKCNRDFKVDEVIHVEIFMADNTYSRLKGIVTRKVELPDTYRKNGLGIQLIEQDNSFKQFLKKLSKKTGKFTDLCTVHP